MLTPMDIHNQTFKRSFRGFNEEEVDNFLDQVVNDYEHLWRENDKLKEELARSRKDIEQYKRLEKNLQDTLLVAQKTAEEVTSNAKKSAEELRELTAKECQNMREEADITAKKKLDDANTKVKTIVAEYDRLVREKNKFLRKVKLTLEGGIADIEHTLEELPTSPAIENVEPKPKKQAANNEVSDDTIIINADEIKKDMAANKTED